MSGGVDSSVAAALLKEQGFPVIGLMLRLWSEPGKDEDNKCCTPDSIAQARRIAARLGFPFYVLDSRDIFYQTVVTKFMDGYKNGETPNPCMVCNEHIRWGFLLEQAKLLGAEFMATGHYARTRRAENGKMQLLRGVDENKDQAYVLSRLNQQQLQQTIFPLGEFHKDEVRAIAERFKLEVAHKEESQDLCFLGKTNYREFLNRNLQLEKEPGRILNKAGDLLGFHNGLSEYTIGQRKGINVGSAKPLFVLEKDFKNNVLIVGGEEELVFWKLSAVGANWISGEPPETFRDDVAVRIRYRSKLHPASLKITGSQSFDVFFKEPVRDITPGQYAVIYDGENVLGSGAIHSGYREEIRE